MPPRTFNDATAITVNLKWLLGIVLLLMGLAGSSAVQLYQLHELSALAKADHEALISLTATLAAKGALK